MLAMLYVITVFQYIESLPDSLAAEALRTRVDWKYALHLPLSYQGLVATSFCQFRKWLVADQSRMEVLQALLLRLSEILVVTKGWRLSLNASTAVESVCLLSRLEVIRLTFSQVLRLLAGRQPEWLGRISLPHWYDRYAGLHRPSISSMGNDGRLELAQAIGDDGFYLQNTISSASLPGVDAFPEVAALKRVWQEQYLQVGEGVLWRKDACAGCILSSYK
jgi:transposase